MALQCVQCVETEMSGNEIHHFFIRFQSHFQNNQLPYIYLVQEYIYIYIYIYITFMHIYIYI